VTEYLKLIAQNDCHLRRSVPAGHLKRDVISIRLDDEVLSHCVARKAFKNHLSSCRARYLMTIYVRVSSGRMTLPARALIGVS
jgi:hypothetical protein